MDSFSLNFNLKFLETLHDLFSILTCIHTTEFLTLYNLHSIRTIFQAISPEIIVPAQIVCNCFAKYVKTSQADNFILQDPSLKIPAECGY